jgi:diguanylate cyclase (GGDEF)-like protein
MLPLYRMRSKGLLWSVVSLAIVLSAAGYLLDPPADVWDGVIDRLFSVLVILTVAVGMSKVAQSERRLLLESMTDPLTGLLNRRRFTDLSNREEARSRRHGLPFSVLMIDIDHFKRINDEHGHPVGDQAIKALADICTGASRPHDILARYGGEEFVMTLPQTREDGARVVAERIRSRVEASSLATGTAMVRFTVSIGVSSYAKDMAFQQVIERADQALYEAKRGGRNRIVDLPPATGLAA